MSTRFAAVWGLVFAGYLMAAIAGEVGARNTGAKRARALILPLGGMLITAGCLAWQLTGGVE